jgi:hypothetical protein
MDRASARCQLALSWLAWSLANSPTVAGQRKRPHLPHPLLRRGRGGCGLGCYHVVDHRMAAALFEVPPGYKVILTQATAESGVKEKPL